MPRDIPVGNGTLLINFDEDYCLRDLFYPYVGKENHTVGHKLRFGLWADGVFSWVNKGWNPILDYMPESLVSIVTLANEALGVSLVCNDAVDHKDNVYIKRITVKNLRSAERELRLFFNHDLHILESPVGDTAYYDPDERALIHYKGSRYFLMGGMRGGDRGIDQYAIGQKEFRGLEGTWKDAEDGRLEGNPIAQGSVDSTLMLRVTVPPNGEQTLYYWIIAGQNYGEVSRLNQKLAMHTPDFFIDRTRNYWQSWVNKEEFNLANLPDRVRELYKKSLLILRTNIDARGAIIAANDSDISHFARDTYSYMWPRDGAFVSYALDMAGYHGITRDYFSFCLNIMRRGKEEAGYFLHKYNPDGSLGSSWHPWVNGDVKRLPIQEDGTGLFLWALWYHFDKYRDIEFAAQQYEHVVVRCADFLAAYRDVKTGLPLPSYDLWEERWGIHTFTAAAVYGGLRAAENFARFFGDAHRSAAYGTAADGVKAATGKYLYSEKQRRFLRMIVPKGDGTFEPDLTVDASAYAPFYMGMYKPGDEFVVNTIKAIEDRLSVKTEAGGIARYERDEYQRSGEAGQVPGNPWFITTLWVAQWRIAKAESLEELRGALPILEWVASRALHSGVLAEQVHPVTNHPLSVSPLTWSHAAFVTTVLEYLDKLEEVFICERCGRPMFRHDRDGRKQHRGKEWRKIHEHEEAALGHALTYVTEGDVEYGGRKAAIAINHETCVGATMCAFGCPANIFELVDDKSYLVKENLHRCLLHTCMKCRDTCPTHSVRFKFAE